MTWNIGTRVQTPAIGGAPFVTVTACVPFMWSGMPLVALAGLPGLWECRLLSLAPPLAPEAPAATGGAP